MQVGTSRTDVVIHRGNELISMQVIQTLVQPPTVKQNAMDMVQSHRTRNFFRWRKSSRYPYGNQAANFGEQDPLPSTLIGEILLISSLYYGA